MCEQYVNMQLLVGQQDPATTTNSELIYYCAASSFISLYEHFGSGTYLHDNIQSVPCDMVFGLRLYTHLIM